MKSEPEFARPWGYYGIMGGRPRLDLTDDQRKERRRSQQEAYRRRKGVPPRTPRLDLTPSQLVERRRFQQEAYRRRKGVLPRRKGLGADAEYFRIWGKLPGQSLTAEEFSEREPFWNAKIQAALDREDGMAFARSERELERDLARDLRGNRVKTRYCAARCDGSRPSL